MEGPTSVSAVIHAATLVVAGVIWISKLSATLWVMHSITWLLATGVCAYSILGWSCLDSKRVVAYSTA